MCGEQHYFYLSCHDGKVLSTAVEVFRCNVTGRNRPAAEVAGRGRNAQADATPQHHGRLSQIVVMCAKVSALIIRVPGLVKRLV